MPRPTANSSARTAVDVQPPPLQAPLPLAAFRVVELRPVPPALSLSVRAVVEKELSDDAALRGLELSQSLVHAGFERGVRTRCFLVGTNVSSV